MLTLQGGAHLREIFSSLKDFLEIVRTAESQFMDKGLIEKTHKNYI